MNPVETTIEIKNLTPGDWMLIASIIGKTNYWAYEAWKKNTSLCLGHLAIEDWEVIGQVLECSEGWAYYRYKEFRKPSQVMSQNQNDVEQE